MPNYTLEQSQQPPVIETVEPPVVQARYIMVQTLETVEQEIAPRTEPNALEHYLEVLAERAALERINSENTIRDSDTEQVDHKANEWYFEGLNRTFRNFRLENYFLTAVNEHYARLKNPDR